ncbi:HAD hydrolase family protein [Deinococcus antarcticus]|uniref:HAD hydrolase family protein n=1 Tax=Deinococcus antarcticus TaxID=1298767 RepID=A0ABV8A9B7_9DEIO
MTGEFPLLYPAVFVHITLSLRSGNSCVTERLRQEGHWHATAANNGGLIHVAGTLLHEETLTEADVDALLRHGLPGVPESPYPTALVFSRHGHAISSDEAVDAERMAKYGIQYLTPEHKRGAYKVLYSHPQAADHASHLRATQPHLVVTGGIEPYLNFVSVTPRNATKSMALKRIAAALNIPLEYTVAFGDSDNDADLLETAGFAVQIGTHPHLTPHADVQLPEQAGLNSYLRGLIE